MNFEHHAIFKARIFGHLTSAQRFEHVEQLRWFHTGEVAKGAKIDSENRHIVTTQDLYGS